MKLFLIASILLVSACAQPTQSTQSCNESTDLCRNAKQQSAYPVEPRNK